MPLFKELSNREKTIVMGILIFIVTIAALRFVGIPDQYDAMFAFFDDPELYPEDIYLNNTFFFKSSYFFSINKILGLHRNEIVSFFYYLAVAGVAAYFTYRIITRHFGVDNQLLALLVLAFVCVLGRNVPVNTWGGIIPLQPGTGTMFVKTLSIIAIYFMLENRIWISSVLVTIVIALHLLGDFILPIIFFFYLVFNKSLNRQHLAALLLPAVFLIYKKLTLGVEVSGGDEAAAAMYEAIMVYTVQDADFLAQSKPALVMLVFSFFILPLLWRQVSALQGATQNQVVLLKAIYFASLCVFLAATFYTAIGYRFFLYPPLVALAPVRAMNYYALFFYLSSFVIIVQTARLTTIEKSSVLLALILLHGESINGIVYPLVVLVGGFLVSRFGGLLIRRVDGVHGLVITAMALLIVLTSLQVVRGGKYQTSFDLLGWQNLKRWTVSTGMAQEDWDVFAKIREMPDDFILLALSLTKDGNLRDSRYMNIHARKSHFILDGLHFYFRPKLWKEHKLRFSTYNDLIAALDARKELSDLTIEFLQSRGVTIAVPVESSSLFRGWKKKRTINSYNLLSYAD